TPNHALRALLVTTLLGALACDPPPEPDRGIHYTAEKRPAAAGYEVPALPVASTAAPAEPAPPPVHRTPTRVALEELAMGTHVMLAAYTDDTFDEAALRSRFEKALAEIRRLEALMTTWRDDSEISRINAAAGQKAITVSPETLAVIEKSVWMSRRSEGV